MNGLFAAFMFFLVVWAILNVIYAYNSNEKIWRWIEFISGTLIISAIICFVLPIIASVLGWSWFATVVLWLK